MSLTLEQLIAYVENDTTSAYYPDEDTWTNGAENTKWLFESFTRVFHINDKPSNLLSQYAHGQLTPEKNRQLLDLFIIYCDNLSELLCKLLGFLEDVPPTLIYLPNGSTSPDLLTFWLADCLADPNKENDYTGNVDHFTKIVLSTLTGANVRHMHGELEITLLDVDGQEELTVPSVWGRYYQNPRVAKTLSTVVSMHYFHPSRLTDKIIQWKKDAYINFMSLWANDHTNKDLSRIFWSFIHYSAPMFEHSSEDKNVYPLITNPNIDYQGDKNISLIDFLANHNNTVIKESQKYLRIVINDLFFEQTRYKLLCHILEKSNGNGTNQKAGADPAPMRLNELKAKHNQLTPDTYLHWLAGTLLAAPCPTRAERATRPITALSWVGLVGITGAVLLWHFFWAVPVMSILLHPAWLAASAGTVLFTIAALLLLFVYQPSESRFISSIGKINADAYQPPSNTQATVITPTNPQHSGDIHLNTSPRTQVHDKTRHTGNPTTPQNNPDTSQPRH